MSKKKDTPKFPFKLLSWFCKPHYHLDIEGDLLELFEIRQEEKGYSYARWALWLDVILLFRPGIIRPIRLLNLLKSPTMYRHNFKLGWRHLIKNKGYSLINIGGLTLGMAVAMLLALWIQDETSFDHFHERGDQVYTVKRHVFSESEIHTSDRVTFNIAESLEKNYPEVEATAITTYPRSLVVSTPDASFRESGIYATPSFFDIFSWELLQGDRKQMLAQPDGILLSVSLAKKYFGAEAVSQNQVIGKSIEHQTEGLPPLTVRGIFEDVPRSSSLQFDFVLPMKAYESQNDWLYNWNNSGIRIYVQAQTGTDAAALSQKIVNVQNDHIEEFRSDLFLQAFNDHYLYSSFKDGKQAGGRILYVRIFLIVAIFLILIASINFMNLSTARALQRIKEIGVRKAIGAERRLLIAQFMSESFILIAIAFLLALALVLLSLPLFNGLANKEIAFQDFGSNTLLLFTGIGLLTTLLASTYPALYLSSFDAIKIIRGTFQQNVNSARLRKGLVVFQFSMSILLIVGAITIQKQISYIQNKNLGLDRENVLYFRLEGSLQEQFNNIKEALVQSPGIATVSASSSSPLSIGSNTHSVRWSGKDPESQISMNILSVNFDFLELMKMEVVEGRDFNLDFGTDSVNYIINETARKTMGFEDPIGEQLSFWNNTGSIVGVVKNFHMSSLYSEINPTIIQLRPRNANWLFVKTEPGQTAAAISSLEATYQRFNPNYPFEYRFLDESFDNTYRSEQTIGTLSFYFTGFAMFIACLGLIGLAVYTGQRRMKEISVRKVLGAPLQHLVYILSKDFLLMVLMAFLVASPIAYFLMKDWLNNFAYHVNLGFGIFIIAGLLTLFIALLTVGFYVVKIANKNPVQALKSE